MLPQGNGLLMFIGFSNFPFFSRWENFSREIDSRERSLGEGEGDKNSQIDRITIELLAHTYTRAIVVVVAGGCNDTHTAGA